MSKGLEAYEIVKEECDYAFGQTANGDRVRKNLPIIEKELKALEIIKKKNVSFGVLVNTKNATEYNEFLYETFMRYTDLGSNNLTQEEYNLLKEELQ